jgi:TPP-dependent pyruvate/acetoin dehydrogenase alpha subunit
MNTDPKVALERRQSLQKSRVSQLERLWEIRIFEDRALDLWTKGQGFGICHTCQGQEAIAVGLATVTRPADVISCTYRGHGIALAVGLTPEEVLGEMLGRSIGCASGLGGSMHLSGVEAGMLPTFAIVGGGIPVAVGVGLANKLLKKDAVSIAVFGDGAANLGAFHEGLNLAAIWKLPVLFICENNLYGEYTRINLSTPVKDIAERGASYAMPAHIADGQDVDAVASAVRSAIEAIRNGGGPQLLELKTYRYKGHFHGDPMPTYRPEGELEEWLAQDPVLLFEKKLIAEKALTEKAAADLRSRVEKRIDEAFETVMASPETDLSVLFAHVYA